MASAVEIELIDGKPHLPVERRTVEVATALGPGPLEYRKVHLGNILEARVGKRHHPQVFATASIRREREALAVRAIARKLVPGTAVGQRRRLATPDGHNVDMSKKIEYDLATVGRDVDTGPSAFGGLIDELLGRRSIRLDVPGFVLLENGGANQQEREKRCKESRHVVTLWCGR